MAKYKEPRDFPEDKPVTQADIDSIDKASWERSIREKDGRVWTNEEYGKRRKRVLNTPLP